MDDVGSMVVGPAHEIGVWRGPARSPWVRRIAHGAGFGNQWDLNRSDESAAPREPEPTISTDATTSLANDGPVATQSLRMWWIPSARER